jgi:hypothetical protein
MSRVILLLFIEIVCREVVAGFDRMMANIFAIPRGGEIAFHTLKQQ